MGEVPHTSLTADELSGQISRSRVGSHGDNAHADRVSDESSLSAHGKAGMGSRIKYEWLLQENVPSCPK